MANKKILGRVLHKTDTSANWALAQSFIPLKGEVIVYSDLNKIKIGDGTTTVINLPFVTDNTKEDVANKVTVLSASSTDIEYPSAKVTYDSITEIKNKIPASTTDNAVARFDGTAGNILNSTVIIDDSGKVSISGSVESGNHAKAFGLYSSAAGNGSVAFGEYSHSEGSIEMQSDAIVAQAYAVGNTTIYITTYNGSFLYGDVVNLDINNNIFSGRIESKTYDEESGDYLLLISILGTLPASGFSVGDAGSIELPTQALGNGSHAEGVSTRAGEQGAHAEGVLTVAGGEYSHAEGWNTSASSGAHAEGVNTRATNEGAHAEGYLTKAFGQYSHAEGNNTQVVYGEAGIAGHVEGENSITSSPAGHAEGLGTFAYSTNFDYGAHAEGEKSVATGSGAHAEGMVSTDPVYGEAESIDCVFLSETSFRIEPSIVALNTLNNRTIYIYNNTKYSGGFVAIQYTGTDASSNLLFNITNDFGLVSTSTWAANDTGYIIVSTFASNKGSHAEGIATWAAGKGSHAEGNNTIANSDTVHVQGKNNSVDTTNTYADIVGNGTDDTHRSNAFALTWTGDGRYAGNVYVGCNANSSGGSVVESTANKVTSITSSSTDTLYPSAKATYDAIGRGTLTIQKNGVTIDTFNANATTDKTINIQADTLSPATKSTLGGVIVGNNLNVTDTGLLSTLPGIEVSATAPVSSDTLFWLDTSEVGYDPSGIATAISEHNTSSASHPDKVSNSMIGAANGVAGLDSAGKVPSAQLPSFVDDVIEGYYHNGQFYSDAEHTQLITPETSKIYIDLHTNQTYRWGGSTYVLIGSSLALGETSTTAYRGDRGKIAYDHSVYIGDTAPTDGNIMVWMDTAEEGYDPSGLTDLINEHKADPNAHLITDSVTGKRYKLVIANGILGIDEVVS